MGFSPVATNPNPQIYLCPSFFSAGVGVNDRAQTIIQAPFLKACGQGQVIAKRLVQAILAHLGTVSTWLNPVNARGCDAPV